MAIKQACCYLVECVGNESKSSTGWECSIGKDLIEDLDGKAKPLIL